MNTSSHYSTHNLNLVKKVIADVGDDEEVFDVENYQDVRMELNATSMNLVIIYTIIVLNVNYQ